MLFQPSYISKSGHAPVLAPGSSRGRRRWTAGELTEIVAALATLRTSDIAHIIRVNPKPLPSGLRPHGVIPPALRQTGHHTRATGFLLRRPAAGPSAAYGAAALALLSDDACRWPLGDPAEPGFAFCGAPRLGRQSYCSGHLAQALHYEDANGR